MFSPIGEKNDLPPIIVAWHCSWSLVSSLDCQIRMLYHAPQYLIQTHKVPLRVCMTCIRLSINSTVNPSMEILDAQSKVPWYKEQESPKVEEAWVDGWNTIFTKETRICVLWETNGQQSFPIPDKVALMPQPDQVVLVPKSKHLLEPLAIPVAFVT